MERRRFVGWVLALPFAESMYSNGKKEYVGFNIEEVSGSSSIGDFNELTGKWTANRWFANLKSGRQVEITEKDFIRLAKARGLMSMKEESYA